MSIRECVRCIAVTKHGRGHQCKKNTCIYSEFCKQHTESLFDLTLKPSSIPESGKGLYTIIALPKGHKIAQYTGQNVSQEEYELTDSGYGVNIPHGRIIDAASTQSAISRYANDCRAANVRAKQCKGTNARFSIHTRAGRTTIWVVATKNIPAHSEIFLSYGRGYWE